MCELSGLIWCSSFWFLYRMMWCEICWSVWVRRFCLLLCLMVRLFWLGVILVVSSWVSGLVLKFWLFWLLYWYWVVVVVVVVVEVWRCCEIY